MGSCNLASFCDRKSPRRFSVSTRPHTQKRKLAFFFTVTACAGLFLLAREKKNKMTWITHAIKVSVNPFQRVAGLGRAQRPPKQPYNSKFEDIL